MEPKTLAEIANLVAKHIPQEFFRQLPEAMTAAYTEADVSAQTYGEYAPRMRAQGRFYKGQQHLGRLGANLGGKALVAETDPKGETLCVVHFGPAVICQAVVNQVKGLPEPIKFRRELAAANNSWIAQYQPDLFGEKANSATIIPLNPGLFGMVITVSSQDHPEVTEAVFFGIPNHDMTAWHLCLRVEEFSAIYEREHVPTQVLPEIVPKLRHKKPDSEVK